MFMESAAPHKSVKAWKLADIAAVNAINKPEYRHWAAEVKAHMTEYRSRLTDEQILEDARKYLSNRMWTAMSPRARGMAAYRGKEFLAKCMAHMDPDPLPLGESFIMEFLLSHDIAHIHQYWLEEKPVRRMPYDFYIPDLDLFIEYQGSQHRDGWRGCKKSKKKIQRNDAIKRNHIDQRGSHYFAIEAIKRDDIIFELRAKLSFLGWEAGEPRQLTAKEMRQVQCRQKWSKEAVLLEALKYSNRTAFQIGSPGAHGAAKANGWYKEACAHMEELRHPWSDEEIFAEAAKYQTSKEMREKNYACYSVALKRGLVPELNKRFIQLKVPSNTYTPEHIRKSTESFVYLKDWKKACAAEESAAVKLGIYKEVTKNLLRVKPPNGTWNYDACKEVALQCITKKELKKRFPSAIDAIGKNGWWDELTAHMVVLKRKPYTDQEILEIAAQYETMSQFSKGHSGAYTAAANRGLLDKIRSFMIEVQKPAGWWTKKRIKEEAKKHNTRTKWRKACGSSYGKALALGIMDEACAHMLSSFEARSQARRQHTPAKIAEIARQCQTRGEFKKRFGSVYVAARKLKLLDQVCAHMNAVYRPRNYWANPDNIFRSADGFSTVSAWRAQYATAYVQAGKLGIYKMVSQKILSSV